MSDNEMRAVYLHALCREDGTRAEVMSFRADSTPHGQPGIDYDESYTVEVTKYVPALTDEQVREIAEKWAADFNEAPWRSRSVKLTIESAIREAMGRGERG